MEFEFLKTGASAGVKLEEYKGSISIVTGYEDKEGKLNLDWIREFVWNKTTRQREMREKNTPKKIYLGSRDRALEVLEDLTRQLKGGDVGDDDIPF